MLQRVEADLKEVVQGPVDVTGRREGSCRGRGRDACNWNFGRQSRERDKSRARPTVDRVRKGWGYGARDYSSWVHHAPKHQAPVHHQLDLSANQEASKHEQPVRDRLARASPSRSQNNNVN